MPRHIPVGNNAEFAYDPASDRLSKKHPRIKRVIVVLLVVVLVAACAGVVALGLNYRTLCAQSTQIKELENEALSMLLSNDSQSHADYLSALEKNLPAVQEKTAEAKRIAHNELWKAYGALGGYSDDVAVIQSMTDTMDSITRDVLPQYQSTYDTAAASNLFDAQGNLDVSSISQAVTSLGAADSQLEDKIGQIDSLGEPRNAYMYDAYTSVLGHASEISALLGSLSDMFTYLPSFLGASGDRTYLVLLQSTGSSMPAGGPVDAVGRLSVSNGKFEVKNYYASKFMPADAGTSLVTSEQNQLFNTIAQANYGGSFSTITSNPNFPNVAEQANEFFAASGYEGYDVQSDGVISLDPYALQQLIGISGDVTLADGTKLTGENTAEYLGKDIYELVGSDTYPTYLADLMIDVIGEVFGTFTMDRLLKVSDSLVGCAGGRHAYLWSFHTEDQSALRAAGLAGDIDADPAAPVVGVYNRELHDSELDWYLNRISTVQKTGSNTYHVTYTLNNTLGTVVGMSSAIVGASDGTAEIGHQLERMFVYAPAGGSISNLTVQNNAKIESVPQDGTTVYTFTADVAPAATYTISFDVTCANGARNLLLDQTPNNSGQSGITYDYGDGD